MQISNSVRRAKADTSLSDVERFDRWVSDYAEAHGKNKRRSSGISFIQTRL